MNDNVKPVLIQALEAVRSDATDYDLNEEQYRTLLKSLRFRIELLTAVRDKKGLL